MIATTRGAILRGTRTDEFGEVVDDNDGAVDSWIESRRNFAPNPVPTTSFGFSVSSLSRTVVNDFPDTEWGDGITDGTRFTRSVSAAARLGVIAGSDMPGNGAPISLRMRTRSSVPIPSVAIVARQSVPSGGGVSLGAVDIPAGVSEVMVAGASFPAASGAGSGFALILPADATHIGQTLDVTAIDLEAGNSFDDFFYSDTPDTTERRYSLDAATGASVEEVLVRTVVDGAVVGLEDFPASITERSRAVYDPAEATYRTVRELVARIPAWVSVQDGDRLRDNRTGEIYIIDEDERTPRSISGRSSVTLSLRRTDG